MLLVRDDEKYLLLIEYLQKQLVYDFKNLCLTIPYMEISNHKISIATEARFQLYHKETRSITDPQKLEYK